MQLYYINILKVKIIKKVLNQIKIKDRYGITGARNVAEYFEKYTNYPNPIFGYQKTIENWPIISNKSYKIFESLLDEMSEYVAFAEYSKIQNGLLKNINEFEYCTLRKGFFIKPTIPTNNQPFIKNN